jgi:hypothetical protein
MNSRFLLPGTPVVTTLLRQVIALAVFGEGKRAENPMIPMHISNKFRHPFTVLPLLVTTRARPTSREFLGAVLARLLPRARSVALGTRTWLWSGLWLMVGLGGLVEGVAQTTQTINWTSPPNDGVLAWGQA